MLEADTSGRPAVHELKLSMPGLRVILHVPVPTWNLGVRIPLCPHQAQSWVHSTTLALMQSSFFYLSRISCFL